MQPTWLWFLILLFSFASLATLLLSYLDLDFRKLVLSNFKPKTKPTPLYTKNQTLKASDFTYLLSASDIWHLRCIASHYTSTKPMHADPETVALAVTLEGLGTEGQE